MTTKNDLGTHKGSWDTGKGLFAPQATEGEDTAREPHEPRRALAWVPPLAILLVSASSLISLLAFNSWNAWHFPFSAFATAVPFAWNTIPLPHFPPRVLAPQLSSFLEALGSY